MVSTAHRAFAMTPVAVDHALLRLMGLMPDFNNNDLGQCLPISSGLVVPAIHTQ